MTVADKVSKPQKAKVRKGGVLLSGIIDSGADITMMGGSAFKQVVAVTNREYRILSH